MWLKLPWNLEVEGLNNLFKCKTVVLRYTATVCCCMSELHRSKWCCFAACHTSISAALLSLNELWSCKSLGCHLNKLSFIISYLFTSFHICIGPIPPCSFAEWENSRLWFELQSHDSSRWALERRASFHRCKGCDWEWLQYMSRTNFYGLICCTLCNVKKRSVDSCVTNCLSTYPRLWLPDTWYNDLCNLIWIVTYACLYPMVQATFVSLAVLRSKLALHCGHSGGCACSSDLTHAMRAAKIPCFEARSH